MLSFRDPLLRRNDGVSFAPDGSQSIRGLIFLADKVDTVKRGKSVSGKKSKEKVSVKVSTSAPVKTRFTWESQQLLYNPILGRLGQPRFEHAQFQSTEERVVKDMMSS